MRPSRRVFVPSISPAALAVLSLLLVVLATLGATPARAQACPDADSDGYADCTVPGCDDTALLCGDCVDDNSSIRPSAIEICNQIDDDCNGISDDGFTKPVSAIRLSDVADEKPNDNYGHAVANVGDVDGDGVGDFVVAIPYDDDPTNDAGSGLLYSGASRSILCRMTNPAGVSSDQMGWSAAGVGDLTADGIPDVALGARYDDPGANATGAVHLFSGADCAWVREMSDPGGAANDYLGWSVAGLGDVSGDGVPDIAAGAPDDDGVAGSSSGSVSIFSGADGSFIRKLEDPVPAAGDKFGFSVAGIGDVDSDGVPDIAVGSHLDDNVNGSNAGSVVIFSSADGSYIRHLLDPAGVNNDYLGYAVAGIGDVSGDGVDDILAGVRYDDDAGSNSGSVIIFSGADGTVVRKLTDAGGLASDELGIAVSAMPDISGDGVPDVAAGAHFDDTPGGSNAGSIVVFSGADGSVLHKLVDDGVTTNDYLGRSIAALADVTGDGEADVIAGVPVADSDEETDTGKVLLFSFEADCDNDGVSAVAGDCDDGASGNYPGNAEVCDGVDNDCDGSVDEDDDGDAFDVCTDCDSTNPTIYPGAPELCNGIDDDCDLDVDEGDDLDGDTYETPCDCNDSSNAINPGATELCDDIDQDCDGLVDEDFNQPSAAESLADTFDEKPNDEYGRSIAVLGDVDSDGIDDFVVGIIWDDEGGSNAGSALLYSGADRSPICRMTDPNAVSSDYLGISAAGIGDVTGDSIPDVAIGARYDDDTANNAGAVHLFSGADCTHVRQLLDPDGLANDSLGFAVAALDDVNSDGVMEIIAGAYEDDTPRGNSAGSATVFSGSDGAVLFKLTDPLGRASDQFGYSVAGLGDVDRDGLPDIAVGSRLDNNLNGSNLGSVLLFSGADGSVIRKLAEPGGNTSDYLGESVAGVADLSGDGVPDILVGVRYDDEAGSNSGSVILFSGADGSMVRKYVDPDGAASDELGVTIAAIPDISGDGLPDVAAGAHFDDTPGGSNAGSVVVFSGADGTVVRKFIDPEGGGGDELGTAIAYIADLTGDGVAEIIAGAPKAESSQETDTGKVVIFSFESDCDNDGLSLFAGDCDDGEPGSFPGNTEVCDGVDNDCDGGIDEDDDGDAFDACLDCDSTNPTIYPGAPELCNGIDDDCDLDVDEGDDLDDDTYETPCDCNDSSTAINPGATELCDGIDQDCDGLVDEDFNQPSAAESLADTFDEKPNDEYGRSIAVLGDVGSDGIDDFVVGIIWDDEGGSNAGSALLYSGADRSPICRMTDPNAGSSDYLGVSAAGIGDVTGDGVPDVAIGARYDDDTATNAGAVHLFSGADCTHVRQLLDPDGLANDSLGFAVAALDDVNNDGVMEIIAGAYEDDTSRGNSAGSATVFSGSDGAVLFKLTDPLGRASDQFGYSVAGLGDVDRDGLPDIAVGSRLDNNLDGSNLGSVLLFSGADGSLIRKLAEPGGNTSDYLGESVTGVADLSGDGVPDILTGVRYDDDAGSNSGSVILFSGADGTVVRKYTDPDGAANDELGIAIAAIPDLSGDGLPDVAAGAYHDDTPGGSNAGSVVVFSGADGAVVRKFTDPEGGGGDELGIAIAFISDLSGDGVAEIIAGAPKAESSEETDTGKVVIFSFESDCDNDGLSLFAGDCDDGQPANFPGNPEICDGIDNDCDGGVDEDDDGDAFDACLDCDSTNPTIYPGAPELCNGIDDDCDLDVDEGDDLDGDTFETPCDCDDSSFAINPGAVETCDKVDENCNGMTDEGFAAPSQSVKLFDSAGQPGDGYGTSVAGVGDVDGDGVPDFVVGSKFDDAAGSNAGSALLYSGADRSEICRMTDPNAITSDYLGVSVAGVGDVNSDGVPDVAVGAINDDSMGSNAGAAHLFSGADCSHLRELLDPDGATNDYLGHAIAALEDVNSDGVMEIIAGAYTDDTLRGTNAGSATVFSGADGAVLFKLTDPLGRGSDQLGYAVAGLGDVDLDGVPDVAVAASLDNLLTGTNTGSVLLFSGADGTPIRKLAEPGGSASDHLGHSVAGIGDLDGDGVPDILVGVRYDDDGGTNRGSAIVFSGVDGSVVRKYIDPDGQNSDELGFAVVALPDIDGDGVPDLAAGAHLDDTPGGSNAGSVVVFSGADGTVLRKLTDPGGAATDMLGASLAVIGDISQGGTPELIVGAPQDEPIGGGDSDNNGSVTIFAFGSDCDGDGYSLGDCDDGNASLNPGEIEICDDLDNNCNTLIDEGLQEDPESCNSLDDNCNGLVDEGNPGGGVACNTGLFGVCADGILQCDSGGLDCLEIIGPGPELCNGIDDDCDGDVDEVADSDLDGLDDCSDNCVDSSNPGQEDGDSDGIGDLCDCAPNDPLNPPPVPLGTGLTVNKQIAGPTLIEWPAVAGADRYNVYRGWQIRGDAFVYNQQCLENRVETPSSTDSLDPREAVLFFYLVSTACGSDESTLGVDSLGGARPNPDECPSATLDADGDGWEEAADNCPGFRNDTQADVDSDSRGDVCDNCVLDANTTQEDLDGDGLGDACDPDRDGDGIDEDGDGSGTPGDAPCTGGATAGCDDNCPSDPNPGQEDGDSDGVGDVCDV